MKRSPTTPQPRLHGIVEVFGRTGTGKTHFCTSWPSPIIFDGDGSTRLLRRQHPDLQVVETKSARDIIDTLDSLATSNELPATIVIEGVSFIYNAIVDRHPDDTYKTEINREFREFIERLVAFPCNIVFTSSERDEYAPVGARIPISNDEIYIVKPTDSIKVGVRPEAPQIVEHLCDFVIRLVGSEEEPRRAEVFAQRGNALPQRVITDFTAKTILDAIATIAADRPQVAPTIEELTELGKKLNALLPKNAKTRGLRAYAKSKNIALPQAASDDVRTAIKEALLADIDACTKRNAVRLVESTPAEPLPDAALTSREKFGQPRHCRVAS